jgi:predicted RNase H-like HicB family nuclease
MSTQTPETDTDMRPEYDFSGGVRGKYAATTREEGYTIREYNADGTYTETRVLGEKTVILAPDVWEYFPSSQAVNDALRTLVSLIPEQHPPMKRMRTHSQSADDRGPATQVRDSEVEYDEGSGASTAKMKAERNPDLKVKVVLEPCEEGGYTVYVPSLPGCISEGDNLSEALANIQEAIELYLEPIEDDWVTEPGTLVRELAL